MNERDRHVKEIGRNEDDLPLEKVLRRLEVIKNIILLEDFEDLGNSINKLEPFRHNERLNVICEDLSNGSYSAAIIKIQEFISANNQVLIYVDPEIAALKLEIKELEDQLNTCDNEKSELEKILSEFQNKHTKELGEIILKILKLRKLLYRDDEEKYKEAEKDEEDYQEQVNVEKEKIINEISEEDRAILKKKYRKASMLCHPDKFINEPPEIQKLADEIFKDLSEANEQNDLNRVTEILANLEKGILVRTEGEKIDDKKILKATIMQLTNKLKSLKSQISEIKESETYKTISEIENIDEYLAELKVKLQTELIHLQEQIGSI